MPAYDGGIKFSTDKSDAYPFSMWTREEEGYDFREWPLTREELESLRDDIDNLLNPPKSLVAVSVVGADAKEWHYEDPGFNLQVDDLVRVHWGHAIKIGIVRRVAAEKPSFLPYEGIKPVLARFVAEEL